MENGWTKRIEELTAENKRLAALNDMFPQEIARLEDRVSAEYEAERADDRAKIEELKKENKRLREALERIAAYDSYHSEWPTEIWINAPPEELAHVILSGGKYPPQQTHVVGKL